MSLFTDQFISEVPDLTAYESNLPEIAAAEGIDLNSKLRLAHTEVGAQMEAASRSPGNIYFANGVGWQSSGAESNPSRFELSQVVVTPPLKLVHTFQTLAIVYRDAYNRKLNDKYLPKWCEYKELARWAWDLLLQTGIGITSSPLARPEAPVLDWVSFSLDAAALYVRMTWVGSGATESAGSVQQAIGVPSSNALRVTPPVAPGSVTGWNVYVGESTAELTKQNNELLDMGTAWVMPGSGLANGTPLTSGQEPGAFKTVPRFLQRG